MDLGQYVKKKERGLVEVQKVGKAFVLSSVQFDEETGEQLEPTVQAVSIKQVGDLKARIKEQLENIEELEADLKALL